MGDDVISGDFELVRFDLVRRGDTAHAGVACTLTRRLTLVRRRGIRRNQVSQRVARINGDDHARMGRATLSRTGGEVLDGGVVQAL